MDASDDGEERPQEPGEDLEARLRAEYVAGAEESSRERLGRGLTADELERVIQRFPVL